MLKVLLNVANMAIERADTRTWRTLPGEIYIGRAFLKEGTYKLYGESCGGREEFLKDIKIKSGKTEFILYETMH